MVAEADVSLVCKPERVVVSMAVVEEAQINLMFGSSTFLCKACEPSPQASHRQGELCFCKVDHVVRNTCRGKHGQVCSYATTYSPCRELDFVVLDVKLSCQNAAFGC
ncbi:hypothetical protein EJB05_42875, partial [Eragrostis curvula]